MSRKVDVLIPVYDGFEETVQCVESVLQSGLGDGVFLNVINDCSPNEKLTQWLRMMADKEHFSLYENEKNLGFVKTVNRGMALNDDRDVILLNSDTIVAGNWVARMQAHVEADALVSSVTPFSNNATICSFPNFCEENELLPYSVELIDRAFAEANPGCAIEIPTAIGFCMYITRLSMNDIGYFDADRFGRGYGEENDFCMRAMRAGWKHIAAGDVFVAHIGGVSFSEEKEGRVAAAQAILDVLYPEYHKIIQNFIDRDPLLEKRIQAYAELYRVTKKKSMLLVSHGLGGGVGKHVKELEALQSKHGFLPVIRPSEQEGWIDFSFSPSCQDKICFNLPHDYPKLLELCAAIGVGRVYIHHTMGLPEQIMSLAEDLKCSMDFMIHDYYLINANPTLTSKEGRFCQDLTTRDRLCEEHYEIPFGIPAENWREGQQAFLDKCQRIFAPSEYAANLFEQYFPKYCVERIYHPDSLNQAYPEPICAARSSEKEVKVLVLGAVSREKGANVLEETALLAKKEGLNIKFHLLGYAYRKLSGVIEHGAYKEQDVDMKIKEIDPSLIWYPALWPETYSYTLSEGLKSASPIVASDLGAFPERLRGRLCSKVDAWDNTPKEWLACFESVLKNEDVEDPSDFWRDIYKHSADFYRLFWSEVNVRKCASIDFSGFRLRKFSKELSARERLLMVLIKTRNIRVFGWLVKRVPLFLRRRVSRSLRSKSMHDLLHRKD